MDDGRRSTKNQWAMEHERKPILQGHHIDVYAKRHGPQCHGGVTTWRRIGHHKRRRQQRFTVPSLSVDFVQA